ncbi:MAG: phosphoglycerate dehydrogenase [Hyphomicrobiaceae bacterium]|nr:phosphoglycerate dehydrogenase [Hyphomicrobiaceae bacterium]
MSDTKTPRVLISDKMSPLAEAKFKEHGIDVDYKPGMSKEELIACIGDYNGLAIRSATRPDADVLAAAKNLKVIGRAGIGVDNVDLNAASGNGTIVMNTPFGNSITTAEHAITLMLALARQIPAADASTQASKWEKSRFMGTEVTHKTFAVIGCGNIGGNAAARAKGLQMKVIAFDPFLSQERAANLGVEKVELDELYKRADFISLHTPKTEKTDGMINAQAFAKMKDGVRIINCARGGLIVEADLKVALESGKVGGAALDVYEVEPAKDNPLFGMENVICTPHLGASTLEAQENVALQVAEQLSDYLLTGAITNAINFPSITAEEAPKLKPFVTLADQLGSFVGQLVDDGLTRIHIEYAGDICDLNTKALTSAALAGVLRPMLDDINMISAPVLAKDRGINVEVTTRDQEGAYGNYMRIVIETKDEKRSVAGTVFADGQPRIIQIKGINMEAKLGPHMLYTVNHDKPGYIGAIGELLGGADLNIATFHLGRNKDQSEAIALIKLDDEVTLDIIRQVRDLGQVKFAKRLSF